MLRATTLSLLLLASAAVAQAQQFFQASDGTVDFAKAAFVDPLDPANQDQITSNVAITRGNLQGIFNAVSEAGSEGSIGDSPAGTLWLFGGTVQDVIDGNFSLGDDFDVWVDAAGQNPPATVGQSAVLYLIDDDAFVDLTFTQWGQGGGGGGSFAYTRAVVNLVPEPTAATLLVALGLGLAARRGGR